MNKVPHCSIHTLSPLQFVQVQKEKCNWICSSCFFNDKNDKQDEVVIDLFQIKQNPRKLQELFPQRFQQINKIKRPLENTKKQFETLKTLLEGSIAQVNAMLQSLGSQLDKLKSKIDDLTQLYEKCVQNDQESLIEVIEALLIQGKKVNDDVKQQIEIKFQYHIQKLQEPDREKVKNHRHYPNNLSTKYINAQILSNYDNFKEICKQVEKEIQIHLDKITNISFNDFLFWSFEPIKKLKNKTCVKFQTIHEQQNEKQLDFQQFKNIIEGKQNLMMIFKSKNKGGTQFGVYTPYQWKSNEYQGDENQNTSFIFSLSQNQIFQIKPENSKWTQKIDDQSIRFGGSGQNNEDICIYKNFKTGQSELGTGYRALNMTNKKVQQSFLFGGVDPKIIGFSVHEVTFT